MSKTEFAFSPRQKEIITKHMVRLRQLQEGLSQEQTFLAELVGGYLEAASIPEGEWAGWKILPDFSGMTSSPQGQIPPKG